MSNVHYNFVKSCEREDRMIARKEHLHRLLNTAYGQATAFTMLNPATTNPQAEIQAAIETGVILQATLKKALELFKEIK